jgi:hypothetical protein
VAIVHLHLVAANVSIYSTGFVLQLMKRNPFNTVVYQIRRKGPGIGI